MGVKYCPKCATKLIVVDEKKHTLFHITLYIYLCRHCHYTMGTYTKPDLEDYENDNKKEVVIFT